MAIMDVTLAASLVAEEERAVIGEEGGKGRACVERNTTTSFSHSLGRLPAGWAHATVEVNRDNPSSARNFVQEIIPLFQ